MPTRTLQSIRGCAARCLLAALGLLASALAGAQATLLDDVHTIATPNTGVPVEEQFSITAAGSYQIQLIDLGAQLTPAAPLASVEAALTSGNALVGKPLVGAGTLQFTATANTTYELHVVGMPGSVPGSGPIGIVVSAAAGGAPLYSFSDNIALPPQAVPGAIGILNQSFSPTAAGTYQVALTDLGVPQTLGTLTLLLTEQGASTPLLILPNNGELQGSVTLQSGVTYQVFAIGEANSSANGGLYSATITATSPGGAPPAYAWTTPAGGTTLVGTAALAAGTYEFSVIDLAYPAALAQAAAVVVLNGQAVTPSTAAGGMQSFSPTAAGTYQVFASATPGTGGAGSYAAEILPPSGAPLLSAAQAVTAAGGTLVGYSYTATLPSAATYTLTLFDFQTPRPLVSSMLAAVQAGAVIGTPLAAPGSFKVSAGEGPLTLLAFAEGGQGGSLFDVNVASSNGSLVFDQSQGVGAAFVARPLSIVNSGSYTVTATDLGFPVNFQDLAVVVSRGSTVFGSIFAGGTIPPFQAAAGNYFVNFLATPDPTAMAGTYALLVSTSPPAPVVSLTADETSVASGGTVNLSWTTTNATSCTASGGGWTGHWTGAQAASDTATSPPLSTNTTFTLTCEGAGGTADHSVMVSVTTSSGGGGGALDALLLVLLSWLLLRVSVKKRRVAAAG